MAFLVSAAIVLSYLDRQTLPWTLSQIKADYPFSDQIKAMFDSAFLIAYGLVGFGGAMGGVLLGQIVGWLRDHGYSYTPALMISGSLHVAVFVLICLVIPKIQPLSFPTAK